MEANSQTEDGNFVGPVSVPATRNDICRVTLLDEAAHYGTDGPIPFPIMPTDISALPARSLYGNPESLSSAYMYDLNMPIDMNRAFDQDLMFANDGPNLDYPDSRFPGTAVDTIMSSRCQAYDNWMTASHGMYRAPQFDSTPGANTDRNFNSASSTGVGNCQMTALAQETQNHVRQQTRLSRNYVPRVDDNRVKVNAPHFHNADKLDGRFLSLGYQSNPASNAKYNAYGGTASDSSDSSCFPHGQSAEFSFANRGGSLTDFQNNVGGLMTSWDHAPPSDNQAFQDMNSRFSTSPNFMIPRKQVNMQQVMPTRRSNTLGLENEIETRIISSDPSRCSVAESVMLSNMSGSNQGLPASVGRRMQKVPFNSSVMRRNHQIAADSLKNSFLRSGVSPPPGGTVGEIGMQDKSGFSPGSATLASAVESDLLHRPDGLLPDGQLYPYNVPSYASSGEGHGQGSAVTVRSQISYPSIPVARESHKRKFDLSHEALTQDRRRKVIPRPSMHPYSPILVHNALGQNFTGQSMLAFPIAQNSSLFTGSALSSSVPSSSTVKLTAFPVAAKTEAPLTTKRMLEHASTSPAAFSSPTRVSDISLALPGSAMRAPAALPNTSSVPVMPGGPILMSGLTCAPPHMFPPNSAPPSAVARTISARTGLARMTVPSSRGMVSGDFPPSAHIPAPASALQIPYLSRPSSTLRSPATAALRKSALAALAKASPPFAAPQGSTLTPRIKWQGLDTPHTTGLNCMLCKRDLSYTPEGPVSIPPSPPPVAVLPCGHTFHDHCLLLITPKDQSKDPPCIPCAIGEN